VYAYLRLGDDWRRHDPQHLPDQACGPASYFSCMHSGLM